MLHIRRGGRDGGGAAGAGMPHTQGSNPRLADKAPGRPATHTCEPRLGQPRSNPSPSLTLTLTVWNKVGTFGVFAFGFANWSWLIG